MDQDSKENSDSCNRKRGRDDSECNSPQSKLIRLESVDSDDNSPDPVINLLDSDNSSGDSDNISENHVEPVNSGVNSPEAKRIQVDLLDIFDESDEPMIQGLDSVIKSFEEEILVPVAGTVPTATDVTVCGESQLELGYLLEASDDELGLPPTFSGEKVSAVDLAPVTSGSGATGFGEMLGFEDEILSYDSFEFGLGGDSDSNSYNGSYNDSGDFVALGGLFDYSDENYVPGDISGVQWQPESLSAL